jgi:para-nitrobenzyl esterase
MTTPRVWLISLVLAFWLLPVQATTIGGVVWKWQGTLYNNDTRIEPTDPSRYTILLMPEGHLSVHLDCNAGGGRYTLDGSSLTLEVTHATMAACPPGSLAEKFIEDLAAVKIAFVRDGDLYLDLMYDTGTMKFAR